MHRQKLRISVSLIELLLLGKHLFLLVVSTALSSCSAHYRYFASRTGIGGDGGRGGVRYYFASLIICIKSSAFL